MIEPQSLANEIRDHLSEHPTLKRLGVEVLRAAATNGNLVLRARHRDRVLTVGRTGGWEDEPASDVASALGRELVAEALSGLPVSTRWRRHLRGLPLALRP
jgi:hypothetical protein